MTPTVAVASRAARGAGAEVAQLDDQVGVLCLSAPQVVDTTGDDALGDSDMVDLLGRLGRRQVSAGELREAAVQRARIADVSLNALTCWIPDRLGRTDPRGGLAGIPAVVKDNEDLAGFPTLRGSWAVRPLSARRDAPIVAQLLGQGLEPVGKTSLPEFGLTATTESTRHGDTRNPWHPGRSPGGSSGGSAALVAAGAVPIAHANDGGGSIRIPAACCGLVGLKPSRGRLVDLPEMDRLPVNFITQGVLTRTVRDTATYFAAAERLHANPALPPVGKVVRPIERRLRIGVVTDFDGRPIAPDTTAALNRTAELCIALGHPVAQAPTPFTRSQGRDSLRYWTLLAMSLKRFGGAVLGEPFDHSLTEQFTDGLSGTALATLERIPASLYRLRRWARDPGAGIAPFDILVTPVLAHDPPPIGYLGPGVDFRTHLVRLVRYASFTAWNNVTGTPAISLPLWRCTAGMPLGVQFAAPRGGERTLLELALRLEAAQPWPLTPRDGQPRRHAGG